MKICDKIIILTMAIGLFASCKDPYMPDITQSNSNVLVVEGYIDGSDSTIIHLSRVRKITSLDTANRQFVTDATVYVQNESGTKFPLVNQGQGKYAALYHFGPNAKYQLIVNTPGNRSYKSDLVSMKQAPPIDSVNLRMDDKGALIMVNAHDNTGKTTYYRWVWDDTWEFHSTFDSDVFYDRAAGKMKSRVEEVYICWQSDHIHDILVNSSAKLHKDEVRDFPINHIPFGDYRLSVEYSINVKQYALDSTEFNFWTLLKKNSEDVGTLFDPQPNNIRGNIHSMTDPAEIVIGYIGAGFSSTKRTFFKVPSWFYRQNCPDPVTAPNNKDSLDAYFGSGSYEPMFPVESGLDTTGWVGGFPPCVDCTIRGTNKKPIFWP